MLDWLGSLPDSASHAVGALRDSSSQLLRGQVALLTTLSSPLVALGPDSADLAALEEVLDWLGSSPLAQPGAPGESSLALLVSSTFS